MPSGPAVTTRLLPGGWQPYPACLPGPKRSHFRGEGAPCFSFCSELCTHVSEGLPESNDIQSA